MEQVNELRAVRAEPLISSTVLFMPKMPVLEPSAVEQTGNRVVVDKDMLEKLQKVYQYAVLGYLKLRDMDSNQQKIVAVLRRLQSDFGSEQLAPLWRVASVFFAALFANNISQSAATRSLLWELNKTLRGLVSGEKPGLQHHALLRNLLYYIALAPSDSPALNAIKEAFSLDQAFPSLLLGEREGALHTHLEGAVVSALSDLLETEVTSLASIVDSSGMGDQGKCVEAKLSAERLATSLMVIGQIKLSQSLRDTAGELAQTTPDLPMISTRLQSIQRSLQDWALNYADTPLASDLFSETAYVVDDAQRSLIREVRNNFESIKESIVGYIASQWDGNFLQEIPGQFEHIFGAVEVIGLKRVALIVEQLGNYITSQLLQSEEPPEWSDLDALADAITGFEYYLEAIDKGREGEQRDMLRLTVEAMEKLGFAIDLEAEVEAEIEPSAFDTEIDAVDPLPDAEDSDSEDDDEDEIDPEIKEIFIEEAQEVLAELETNYPTWVLDPSDEKILNELRRGFHTLKGSGRMVKANAIGDLAWSIENMLNKILEKPGAIPAETVELIDISLGAIPSLVDDFECGNQHVSPYCVSLIAAAEALTKGEAVTLPREEEQGVELENLEERADSLSESDLPDDAEALVALEDNAEVQPVVQIFVGEAGSYIKTLANYLDDFQQPHEGSRLAPADVQRALHTLQASAGMAGFMAVSELAGTLEDFLITLYARGQNVSSRIIALLMNGVDRLRDTLARLEAGDGEDSAGLNEYRSHVELAREQWQEERTTGTPPRGLALLQQLMVTGLENVLLADSLLDQWFAEPIFSRQDVDPLVNELAELSAAAENSGVSSLSMLCAELSRALSHIADLGQGIDDGALNIFKAAHEQILSMMDIVAIGQPVAPAPAEIFTQLEAQAARVMPAEELNIVGAPEVSALAVKEPSDSDDLASRMAGEAHDPDVLPFFLEEADDLLEDIENAMQAWRDEPGDISQGELLNRVLHTLKGSARLAGLSLLGDLSHDLEALILQEEGQLVKGDAAVFDLLFSRYDELLTVLDWVKSGGAVAVEEEPLAEELSAPEIETVPEAEPELVESLLPAEEPDTALAEASVSATQEPTSRDDLARRMADEVHDPDVLPFFLEEADDLLEDIENAMQTWRNEPGDVSQSELLNRVLHTLKGGARLAGLSLLGDLSHDLEALILQEEGQLAKGDAAVFDLLFTRYDELLTVLDWVKSGDPVAVEEEPPEEAPAPEIEIVAELEPEPESTEVLEPPVSPEVFEEKALEAELPELLSPDAEANPEPEIVADQVPAVKLTPKAPAQPAAGPKPAVAVQESIKIPAQVLDNLVNLAGVASIARGRVEQGVGE
ncbi:MAG: Hpt domain-containing protein, partial [Gammaproteobacteria bacterium]|nr:Hpt domain-containing protein [Gammaproteobacteria bacterium]